MGSRTLFDFALPKSWRRNSQKKEETTPAPAAAEPVAEEKTESVFDEVVEAAEQKQKSRRASEHSYKSAFHKMSPRKLNDISRQVAGLPVDEALIQLQFSEKRVAKTWVKSTLALARDHAVAKGMDRSKLVVSESWVSKGSKVARLDIKGRGRMGIKHHQSARVHFLLKEGKTYQEKLAERRKKELNKIKSAGVVREDGKIRRKVISGWAW
ncbi:50S ribosomal protein L22 [Trichosporon asahii var. asahii CBS 8904]|uniref:50S ribosomal protein L22 n=2 Tax=Trichosporon asahii var. asahii TaxID=189963 RepID=K1VG74_TRIAC|nr:50S ribosomal protein L22 [Trichosporon asahii var. asahii CBS 2479]EJT51450.1 50S ribosomal protein L22 [Trichosporon asahii var. asahii CBS 2479]EKD03080.1 50S ribosomal protein L22 [Trichosporon asahii var. asahii CBS 8904]